MRKRRTRSHIIADLSANHFERHALLCGFTVERVVHDYGIDLLLYTFNDEGEVENETIKIQLKATDHPVLLQDEQRIAFPISRSDLEHWLREWMPVLLVVYDAQADTAYWVYIQAYFQRQQSFDLSLIGDTVTLYLPRANVVNSDAVRTFARYKADILRQQSEVIHYDT